MRLANPICLQSWYVVARFAPDVLGEDSPEPFLEIDAAFVERLLPRSRLRGPAFSNVICALGSVYRRHEHHDARTAGRGRVEPTGLRRGTAGVHQVADFRWHRECAADGRHGLAVHHTEECLRVIQPFADCRCKTSPWSAAGARAWRVPPGLRELLAGHDVALLDPLDTRRLTARACTSQAASGLSVNVASGRHQVFRAPAPRPVRQHAQAGASSTRAPVAAP